jgi:hypothetical protein
MEASLEHAGHAEGTRLGKSGSLYTRRNANTLLLPDLSFASLFSDLC